MATLRDIRRKIVSVKKTQQITKAMKMVAAAKFRRAQERVNQIRPYAESLENMLANVTSQVENLHNPYLEDRGDEQLCYIVIAADRGLCGSFNSNLVRQAVHTIVPLLDEGKRVELLTVGKKSYEYFRKRKFSVAHHLINFFNHLDFSHALDIAQFVNTRFLSGEYHKVQLLYTRALSPVKQQVTLKQLLPVKGPDTEPAATHTNVEYIFEPSPEILLNALCVKSVNIHLWHALAESQFAEEGARMIAMSNATDNAQEMINSLTLTYNKARQAVITKEISEIVGGAEALR